MTAEERKIVENKINVSFEETIGRMCDSLREDKEFLNSLADSVLKSPSLRTYVPSNSCQERQSDTSA